MNKNNIISMNIKVIISIRNGPSDINIIDLYKVDIISDIKVITLYFKDKEEYAHGKNGMRQYLGYTYKIINDSLSMNKKVLVHCTRGNENSIVPQL